MRRCWRLRRTSRRERSVSTISRKRTRKSCCNHHVKLVSSATQMPGVLQRAMRAAVLERGVAVIVLPGNVALAPAIEGADTRWTSTAPSLIVPAERGLDRFASIVNDAEAVPCCVAAAAPALAKKCCS